MATSGFATSLGGLQTAVTGALEAAGIVGNGSTPTTHITTQVPASPVSGNASAGLLDQNVSSTWNWVLLIGLAILVIATIHHFSKYRRE